MGAVGLVGAVAPAEAQTCPATPLWAATLDDGTPSLGDTAGVPGAHAAKIRYVHQGPSVQAVASDGSVVWTKRYLKDVGGVAPAANDGGADPVFVTNTDGFVHRLDATTGRIQWSFDARRAGCPADGIGAAPALQRRAYSDGPYRAAHAGDLVIVATRYGCGTTTANQVIGLRAADGTVAWRWNDGVGVAVDQADAGCAIDLDSNTVYCGTTRPNGSIQATLFAISTVDGALRWSADVGPLAATPTIRAGRLYVGDLDGNLTAIRRTDGATLWRLPVTGGPRITQPVAAPVGGMAESEILAVDAAGDLHVVRDLDSTAAPVYPAVHLASPIRTRPVVSPNTGRVYVGLGDGTVHQVVMATGADEVSVVARGTVFDAALGMDGLPKDWNRLSVATRGRLQRFCIPWSVRTPKQQTPSAAHKWKQLFGSLDGNNGNAGGTAAQGEVR